MNDEVSKANRERVSEEGLSRRLFLRATLAGGASLLAGRAGTLFAAASANDKSSFSIGGDLSVNRLGFGAMRLTGEGIWGWPPDRENALKVLRRAVELGANLIDTADVYGPETDELLIAEALYPYPKGLVIATKGGNTRPGPDQWVPDEQFISFGSVHIRRINQVCAKLDRSPQYFERVLAIWRPTPDPLAR